jgi:hypothetical protein
MGYQLERLTPPVKHAAVKARHPGKKGRGRPKPYRLKPLRSSWKRQQ